MPQKASRSRFSRLIDLDELGALWLSLDKTKRPQRQAQNRTGDSVLGTDGAATTTITRDENLIEGLQFV